MYIKHILIPLHQECLGYKITNTFTISKAAYLSHGNGRQNVKKHLILTMGGEKQINDNRYI